MKNLFKIIVTLLLVCAAIALAMQGVTAIYDFPSSEQFKGKYIYNPYQNIDSTQFVTSFAKADCPFTYGYNFTGFELQCFGVSKPVVWFDYLLMPFASHQSQYIVSKAAEKLPLTGVNAAHLRGGANASILKTLTSYDVISVDNTGRGSWDVGLSNGHYSTLSCGGGSLVVEGGGAQIEAIRDGRSYMIKNGDESHIKRIVVQNDTINIELNVSADSIVLIGQQGALRQRSMMSTGINYPFLPDDTYIRAEIHLSGGVIIWTNPIVRTEKEGVAPIQTIVAPINVLLTVLNSVMWGLGALIVLLLNIPLWHKRNKNRTNRRKRRRNLYAPLQYIK